jgi:tetratricopeptide (TPR) repeat protein
MFSQPCLAVFKFCVGLGVIFAACVAHAGKPIPCGKDAPTEATWNAEVYAHWCADMEFYKKLTQDPPEVQKDVLLFLEDYLKKAFDQSDSPSWETLEKQGEQLAAAGAKDPYFRSTLGNVKINLEKLKEGRTLAKAAFDEISASQYPTSIKHKVCARWRPNLGPQSRRENDPWQVNIKETLRLVLALLAETADQPKEQKFIWHEISYLVESSPNYYSEYRDVQKDFFEAVSKTGNIHPWMKNMIEGFYYNRLAWELRGSGFANTVTPEGWRGFQENIEKASTCFTKAWELDPTVPYAAAEMIYVTNSGADSKLSPRDWFDRAVEARMDFERAYGYFIHHLSPQWHGSHEAMFQFGLECLRTKRYDTNIPFRLIKILAGIDGRLGGKGEIWREEGVYEQAKTVLETFEKELPYDPQYSTERFSPAWILSFHGAIAAKAGQYADARKAFDKVGVNLQSDAFSYAHAHFPLDGSRVYALTGGGRKEVEKIEGLIADGGLTESANAKSVRELLDKAAAATQEPQAQSYFNHWKNYLLWRELFEKGEWIELTFDKNFSMWQITSGTWRFENPRSVVSDAHYLDNTYNGLCCEVPFEGPLEIEFDVAHLDQDLNYLSGVMLGNAWDHQSKKTGCFFYMSPPNNAHGIHVPKAKIRHDLADTQLSNHMRMQAWDEACLFYFNDCESPVLPVKGMTLGDKIELTGQKSQGPTGRTRFSNVRVRKLIYPPPPMEKGADRLGYFDSLIAAHPEDGFLYYQRGLYRKSRKQWPEAEADLKKALSLSNDIIYAHLALNQVEISLNNYAGAVEEVDQFLKIKPDDFKANNYQAWTLATCPDEKIRNGKLAVEHARKACELTNYKEWTSLDTLAAACAENSDFDEAVKWETKALKVTPWKQMQPILKSKVKLYQSKKPYRDK